MRFAFHFLSALLLGLLIVAAAPACDRVVVSHATPYVASNYVAPSYTPAIVAVPVAVVIQSYGAGFVQPVAAAPAVVQQPAAVAPQAPAAAPAASLSPDDCRAILAGLKRLEARQEALEHRLGVTAPPPTMPPSGDPAEAKTPPQGPVRTSAALNACAVCHTTGKEVKGAPALFDALGQSVMTDHQLRKATSLIKNGKMPPPTSAQATMFTPEVGNSALDAIDELPAFDDRKPQP